MGAYRYNDAQRKYIEACGDKFPSYRAEDEEWRDKVVREINSLNDEDMKDRSYSSIRKFRNSYMQLSEEGKQKYALREQQNPPGVDAQMREASRRIKEMYKTPYPSWVDKLRSSPF